MCFPFKLVRFTVRRTNGAESRGHALMVAFIWIQNRGPEEASSYRWSRTVVCNWLILLEHRATVCLKIAYSELLIICLLLLTKTLHLKKIGEGVIWPSLSKEVKGKLNKKKESSIMKSPSRSVYRPIAWAEVLWWERLEKSWAREEVEKEEMPKSAEERDKGFCHQGCEANCTSRSKL